MAKVCSMRARDGDSSTPIGRSATMSIEKLWKRISSIILSRLNGKTSKCQNLKGRGCRLGDVTGWSNSPSSLDNFAKLSVETRFMIWEYLFPSGNHTCTASIIPDQAAAEGPSILRTSKTIYDEISDHLYSALALKVEVSPQYCRAE
jgi:hypothetical protein